MKITGYTKLICLLGSPVSHSISPAIHNLAFQQLDLDYSYMAFDVTKDKLKTAVTGLRTLGVAGFNVTMPLKNEICKYLDELSRESSICGSVNTVVNKDGRLIGYTTDGYGFVRSAEQEGVVFKNCSLTLLGTGGAACSILVATALAGASHIYVFGREGASRKKAEGIGKKLQEATGCSIDFLDINDREAVLGRANKSDILVNATSLGMAPDTERAPWSDFEKISKDLLAVDIIYNPRETLFLRLAREAGLRTLNGLSMLLYQGSEAFRLWTGMEMNVDMVREKVFKEKK